MATAEEVLSSLPWIITDEELEERRVEDAYREAEEAFMRRYPGVL